MRLTDYVAKVFDAPISNIKRQAIAIAVCTASGIGALFYAASAGVLLLEEQLGAVSARLIMAAILVLIAVAALMVPRLVKSESMRSRAAAESKSMTPNEQLALIIEAALVGFNASKRAPGK